MEINEVLARNLSTLREQQNLSLGQLAQISGLSKVMLSQLEKGSGNPTINTILKIANALKVPYTALLDTLGSSAAVVRGSDLVVQSGKMAVEVGGRRYELGQDDAISFHSSQEHCYINTGTGTAIAHAVNYYPV